MFIAIKNLGSAQIFAIEIRKAMEAICEERGIDSKDNEGKYKGLGDKIKELARIAMLPKPIEDLPPRLLRQEIMPPIQQWTRMLSL